MTCLRRTLFAVILAAGGAAAAQDARPALNATNSGTISTTGQIQGGGVGDAPQAVLSISASGASTTSTVNDVSPNSSGGARAAPVVSTTSNSGNVRTSGAFTSISGFDGSGNASKSQLVQAAGASMSYSATSLH